MDVKAQTNMHTMHEAKGQLIISWGASDSCPCFTFHWSLRSSLFFSFSGGKKHFIHNMLYVFWEWLPANILLHLINRWYDVQYNTPLHLHFGLAGNMHIFELLPAPSALHFSLSTNLNTHYKLKFISALTPKCLLDRFVTYREFIVYPTVVLVILEEMQARMNRCSCTVVILTVVQVLQFHCNDVH